MAGLGAYSVYIQGDPPVYMKQNHLQLPLLLRYQAYGWGIGKDDQGKYIALILVHTDETTARENVNILRRRISETWDVDRRNMPYKEVLESEEIRTDGRALLAKLRVRIPLKWLEWINEIY